MIHISNKEYCCGCSACESVCGHDAIKLVSDSEGFKYPVTDLAKCIECGLCEKTCPVINRDSRKKDGIPLMVMGVFNKNSETVAKSSSGGVFQLIAEMVLASGGLVYGVAYDKDMHVRHMSCTTALDLDRFRGSKYVQSDLDGIFVEIRKHLCLGKKVLFIGTPCQVEGLKLFLAKDYNNLLTVDLVCHGVPSPKLFSDYIGYVNKHLITDVSDISMKDKSSGWHNPKIRLHYGGKSETNTPLAKLWSDIYFDNIATRPICHSCRWTNYNRPGDITIGDFWGIEKSHPDFSNDNGISLLFANTPKGKSLWNDISNKCESVESSVRQCCQEALCSPTSPADDRADFWRMYKTLGFAKTVEKRFCLSKKRLLLRRIKAIVARALHI